MAENIQELKEKIRNLERELSNFQTSASGINANPGDIPELEGIDIAGCVLPLNGLVGGDHILYADFKKRYHLDTLIDQTRAKTKKSKLEALKNKAGVLLSDVSGHDITDAALSGRLHDAFFMGVLYELEMYGEVTSRLFEKLNTRFHNSSTLPSNFRKYMTMIYGEITDEGTFRFISAAHPNPVIFSSEFDRIGELDEDNLNGSYPLGVFPSGESTGETQRGNPVKVKGNYFVNQIKLESPGDIILLHSDGLSDHNKKGDLYFPNGLEDTLRETKHLPAEEIVDAIGRRVIEFADPADDISYIVIKKV